MKLKKLLKRVDTDKYNIRIKILDDNKSTDFYFPDEDFHNYNVVSIAPARDSQDELELIVEIKAPGGFVYS